MRRKAQTVPKKAEIFSSIALADERVYFRMRHNTRLRRSRLVVSPEEGLVVESPRGLDVGSAERLIARRKTWVLEALDDARERRARARNILTRRNSVLVFGREKLVHVRTGQSRDYVMEGDKRIFLGFTLLKARKAEVERRLCDWLKGRAQRYLPLRVRHLNQDRFSIAHVAIKDQKTIWGSCSANGDLSLNWRLIMAPRLVSDYIICHELCHTRHLNHSARFWHLVASVFPRYEEAEKWCRDYGFLLHVNLFSWM